jgi:polysaccharide chain length determinant protein (PEP-CTERM system associated)
MQPSQDLLSVARRPMDVEDYIDVIRRHKSWIIGPTFLALVASVVLAFFWPDTFVSQATIQVVPPQVPERYVPSNVNSEMTQRINAMANSIESRANLTNLINTHGLYRSQLSRKPLEDVIEDMRRDIHISPVGSLQTATGKSPISAFKVAFEYSNRYLAQKVAAELARDFIDANIRALASQSAATTDFLKDQWEAARRRLDELENRMTDFRLKNAGRLPDQLQANLQTLRSLETQLAGVNDVINRIGQEKLLLENQVRIYRDQLTTLKSTSNSVTERAKDERLAQAEREILTLEAALSGLRERYKSTHPDVKQAEAQLAALRSRRDALLKEAEQRQTTAAPARPSTEDIRGAQEIESAIARLQGQIQVKDLEMEERTKTQKKINDAIDAYNARIQSSPIMERDYAELSRDYDLAKSRYEDLNLKKSQSETATALENRQYGERLELLESASLPETPDKPNRIMMVSTGLGIGLVLGLFITGVREMKDTSLKNLKDARAYTNLPVLGTVPLLENDLVVRRKRRLTWLAWSAATILGIVAMTRSIYYYYSTKL